MTIVEQQIQAAIDRLSKTGADNIVIATYDREEFQELRRGEDYDLFKRQERAFAEGLASRGFLDRIKFQPIAAEGYYRYLSAHPELSLGEASRASYAAFLANEKKGKVKK